MSKKISGLTNLGNTCFLNSCVQVMAHTQELNNFFDNLKQIKSIDDAIVVTEYNDLRKLMIDNDVISPKRFIHFVQKVSKQKGNTIFSGYQQNDVMEFFTFLLDCIHNSVCRGIKVDITGVPKTNLDSLAMICYNHIKQTYEKEYSEITDIFFGIYVSQVKTPKGGKNKISIQKPEYFNILDLPINSDTQNIYDCFDLYTSVEEITDYINDKTGKTELVHKNMTFWSFPKILAICLKRFDNDMKKKGTVIECPECIDLSKYVIGYSSKSYIYELYATCNHTGNVHGGHYTCLIKKNGVWYNINDESVEIYRGKIISSMTYCLFYRKKNN